LLLVYSTMWPSIIGHQIQADPAPEWVHVDELFHSLGSIPYKFRMDADFAQVLADAGTARGLKTRTVNHHGFPIDTGSVVALKLLNPDNRIPACVVSSNIYSDRAETVVWGKAARDAMAGRKVAVVVVMTLSNRLFTKWIEPHEDRIHSAKDEEWNRKLLEFLEQGRLEDVAQLSREIHKQIRIKKVVNFKPMWWLSTVMGNHNNYDGTVHAYAPLFGTGGAVVTLQPSTSGMGLKEFDEDDVEVFGGDRNLLDSAFSEGPSGPPTVEPVAAARGAVVTDTAPKPVGAYPHARRVGDLLYLSGVGPRQPGTNAIPGGPIVDGQGAPRDYDVAAQTRAVIENIRKILEAAGSSLDKVVDVTAFLVDMDRDFKTYNAVYAEAFAEIGPTRTTVAVRALPTPIAVEFKVIALP
jgi:2-aminomuconate deaminase